MLTIKTPTELFAGSARWQVHSEFQIREDCGVQPESDTWETHVCLSGWKTADMCVCVCLCVCVCVLGKQERWQEADEETLRQANATPLPYFSPVSSQSSQWDGISRDNDKCLCWCWLWLWKNWPRRSSCWWRNNTSGRQSRGIRWWNACQRPYGSPLKVRGSGSFMQLTCAECPSCARRWRCMAPIWKLLWHSFTRRRKRHSSLPPGCSGSRNNYHLYIVTLYLD